MLTHPTLDKLQALRLTGMYHAFCEQLALPESAALSFEERLGLLVDREVTAPEYAAPDQPVAAGQAPAERVSGGRGLSGTPWP
jgi:hypothetical protein